MLLAELPAGKSAFNAIVSNQTIGAPGGVAWDGKYLAVGDYDSGTIYQFTVSRSRARVQGSTMLTTAAGVFQFWFTGSGLPRKTISGLESPAGVAVSK